MRRMNLFLLGVLDDANLQVGEFHSAHQKTLALPVQRRNVCKINFDVQSFFLGQKCFFTIEIRFFATRKCWRRFLLHLAGGLKSHFLTAHQSATTRVIFPLNVGHLCNLRITPDARCILCCQYIFFPLPSTHESVLNFAIKYQVNWFTQRAA